MSNQYLDFEDQPTNEEPEFSETLIEEENLDFSEEDLATLARRSSGYGSNTTDFGDSLNNSAFSQSETEEEAQKNDDATNTFSEEIEPKKKSLRKPHIKIIAGIFITSLLAIGLIFFRGSWLKLMSLRGKEEAIPEAIDGNKDKQTIDELRAELALVEQDRIPIDFPAPDPKPIPQPEGPVERAARKPRPKPKPQPKPQPVAKAPPIDPYEQWDLLSKLGTQGDSAIASEFKSEAEDIASKDGEEETDVASNNSDREKDNSLRGQNQEEIIEVANNQGRLGQTALNKKKSSSALSAQARRLILGGYGVDSSNIPAPQQDQELEIASTAQGVLQSTLAWTEDTPPEEARAYVQLEEPIKYSNGSIAIPADASILVELASWDKGFASLDAIAITYKEDGEIRQKELPRGTLLIRSEDNQPLAFKTKKSGGSGVGNFVGGLASESARSLPVPRQVTTPVARVIRTATRRERGNDLYSLKAKTPVAIYVNNSINLASLKK